jgi:hypothetical protein
VVSALRPCRSAADIIARCIEPGSKLNWWKNAGVDAINFARQLWIETHPLRALATSETDGGPLALAVAAKPNLDADVPKKVKERITKTNPDNRSSDMTSLQQIESNRRNASKAPVQRRKAASSGSLEMQFAMD